MYKTACKTTNTIQIITSYCQKRNRKKNFPSRTAPILSPFNFKNLQLKSVKTVAPFPRGDVVNRDISSGLRVLIFRTRT